MALYDINKLRTIWPAVWFGSPRAFIISRCQ